MPNYQTTLQGRKLDYALFLSNERLDDALRAGTQSSRFWEHATVVADAKAWGRSLDRRTQSNDQREFPPQQMEWYLDRSRLPYGFLTNGRQWRLIPRERQPYQGRYDTYFEVRLTDILDAWLDPKTHLLQRENLEDDFLQFYLFFSPQGFVATLNRTSLIERAVRGSSEYRLGIGEDLRLRAFDAVRLCMQGLLDFKPNELNATDDIELCRLESFTLIYRLLFILYAEDRSLLPYGSHALYTKNRSLGRLREDIQQELAQARSAKTDYQRTSVAVWDELHALFDLVDSGDARYVVPPYNCGLYDPGEQSFWEEHQLSDWYLARIVHKLGHAVDPLMPEAGEFRVDYRDLAIQRLGGVYESLLELEPHVAKVPMQVIAKRSRDGIEEKIVPKSSPLPAGFQPTGEHYELGTVFLQTNKGERRASGSYYTPDSIVNHIVEQTLRPICERIEQQLESEIAAATNAYETSRAEVDRQQLEGLKGEFDDRVLALRVLDPAMGSGHFLLRACGYLAEQIATHPYSRDESSSDAAGESAVVYWKRRVAENCLFGVDLNGLAVELAKLALWLETVAADRPLTYLDHHLRCGDSLIGPTADDLGRLPGQGELQASFFKTYVRRSLPKLLEPLTKIRELASHTVQQVKEKQRHFTLFQRQQAAYRRVTNVWSSAFLPMDEASWTGNDYLRALLALEKADSFSKVAQETWFATAENAAHENGLTPFAWELEFPDVFFNVKGRKERAGFDAIIGNPPYDVLSELESGRDLSVLKQVIKYVPDYAPSLGSKNNLYKVFVCRALKLLADGGYLGFITPMAVLGDKQAVALRRGMLEAGRFVRVDAFPQKDSRDRRVFREAKLSTAVFIMQKTRDASLRSQRFRSEVHPGCELEEVQASLELSSAEIPHYDAVNQTIVSCSQADWDLATRIMQTGRLGRLGDFCQSFQGEFNETNDGDHKGRGLLSEDETHGTELIRGAHVCQYAVRAASQGTNLFLRDGRMQELLKQSRDPDAKLSHHRFPRIGFQRKSPQNNFRRLIAVAVPVGAYLLESVSYVPEHHSQLPLPFVLALLNSKLAEWYFRLGSTNAMVGEYQISNLPCPLFRSGKSSEQHRFRLASDQLARGAVDEAVSHLAPDVQNSPFDPFLEDLIMDAVERIERIEHRRGDITRTERSALSPEAQPYQNFIDWLLFRMAGLTDDEIVGLEARLMQML